jgi:hypothetical protein
VTELLALFIAEPKPLEVTMACNSLGYPWGPREDETLARMWNDGLPAKVIAHEMGRTVFTASATAPASLSCRLARRTARP